ncbi:NADH dehydrogenase [Sistotremastrum niveocremeum HHB9708]|uniref:NADH dehydrogenase n=1 Tax=Sistotremastrum niveocremeum HHB9708 TaxID=1314777 RepID=A0A164UG16_9AGAM|nr:NADH dehydrogenase [Sistotremastrum niveocremeum HHB9708]
MITSQSLRRMRRGSRHSAASARAIHDLIVSGPTKKPIIAYGPPGRSAVTGQVATVFGCTGFLGRYLVAKLAKAGTQVIVPYRDEDMKRHLKPMGDLGQIVNMEWDLRNDDQVRECLRHSDIVYNLVSRDYETKNYSFEDVNVTGAAKIASLAQEAKVSRFVHVSHLNASPTSPSKFYATKAKGEEAVRESFPMATIVRPGPIYGYEDRLLRSIATWPSTWKMNNSNTKLRPVHVMDVAQGLTNLIYQPALARTLSLPGPQTFTIEQMFDLVQAITMNPASKAPHLPKFVAKLLARTSDFVWWPVLSPDQVERRYIDDANVEGDWDALGVVPDEIERHAVNYLQSYRAPENMYRPPVIPDSTNRTSPERSYHVMQ